MLTLSPTFFADARDVLGVFLIPFGGGIPAGVLLAQSHHLDWFVTAFLYFVSDVILACIFEPLMLLFISRAKHSPFLTRFAESYKETLAKTGFKHGLTPSPFSLIVVAFGVDPMTGRAASRAAGYGFLSGWTLAICGDMVFFALIMASTLCLNNLLGDGTLTAIIIMVAMIAVPSFINRWKDHRRRIAHSSDS